MSPVFTLPYLLIVAGPEVLVSIVGICMAIARRQAHPRASLVAVFGFSVLMAHACGAVATQEWMFRRSAVSHDIVAIATQMGIFAAVLAFIQAVALALVVAAVFVDRSARS